MSFSKTKTDSKIILILDTEGSHTLTEIAIVNDQEKLIYEAFIYQNNKKNPKLKSKPLDEIIKDLSKLLANQIVVCHNAQHDAKILRNSFQKCHQPFPPIKFVCTIKLAQQKYFRLPSYSLENLAHKLFLKVNHRLFERQKAHSAYYDAQFTLKLYQNLISKTAHSNNKPMVINTSITNPFSTNRVDNPFQKHLDFPITYQKQFKHLQLLIEEIKSDTSIEKQSKAAVVLAEAGNGKTHLMMRLTEATLKTNRVLYVRQPNNAESVMHHIYSRILESFAQKIEPTDSQTTQLDLLLARTFTRILKLIQVKEQTEKLSGIIKALENDNLILYKRLGKQGSPKHTDNWKYIESKVIKWWESNYSTGGYSPYILQGILKFCRYKDDVTRGINYKDKVRRWLAGIVSDDPIIKEIGLNNWQEDNLSKEDFALEAIRLFAQLSTLDEPLIIVFDQLESLINRPAILESFGNAVREIITVVPNSLIIVNLFPDRWQHFRNYWDNSVTDRLSLNQITLQTPSIEELTQILQLKCQQKGCDLNQLFTDDDLKVILSQSSIRKVINKASDYYRYRVCEIALPQEYKPKNTLDIEQRVGKLENALQQIINICTPLVENITQDNSFPEEKQTVSPQIDDAYTNIIDDYLQVNQKQLDKNYHNPHIITDDDDYGKLVTIIEGFEIDNSSIEKDQLALGKKILPPHLLITKNDLEFVVGFLNIGGSAFTSRIKNFNQLALSYPKTKFYLLRDDREGEVSGKVGRQEIKKLNYLDNGNFIISDRDERVLFELLYQMIVDINQADLEVNTDEAISIFSQKYNDYWLVENLK